MNVDDLKSLAKELPTHQPDVERVESLRASLLQAVEREQPRVATRSPYLVALGVSAVAAAIAFYIGRYQGSESLGQEHAGGPALSSLRSVEGAHYERSLREERRAGVRVLVEEVRLQDGSLAMQVQPDPKQELRIRTEDARIEGQAGAQFELSAEHDALRAVRVVVGQVRIEITNQPAIVLGPGQSWQAPITEAFELRSGGVPDSKGQAGQAQQGTRASPLRPANPRPRLAESLSPEAGTKAKEGSSASPEAPDPHSSDLATEDSSELAIAAAGASPGEQAFRTGYRALKDSDYQQAIAALRTAIDTSDDEALRGDARYWLGIALARAGKRKAAISAMSEFLNRQADDARVGEVAAMLGWLYVDEGRLAEAAPLFERAGADLAPRVRASAAAGLRAIAEAGHR